MRKGTGSKSKQAWSQTPAQPQRREQRRFITFTGRTALPPRLQAGTQEAFGGGREVEDTNFPALACSQAWPSPASSAEVQMLKKKIIIKKARLVDFVSVFLY